MKNASTSKKNTRARMLLAVLALAGAVAARTIDGNAPGIPAKITEPPPLPKEFAYTFSLPYGAGDKFPKEPEEFDRMLGLLKDAGFNTVHCPYADWRPALFKKHGMKMMIDVLAWKPPVEADIRNPEQRPKVKAMCEKLRGAEEIWGYNLWNERLDWCGNFDYLDAWIRMLRTWDPTHPVWVGTYQMLFCEHYPTAPGVMAWYDYHWERGFGWNLKMLNFYREKAAARQCSMGKWEVVLDRNRNLYTINTAIAHGVKTFIWFIGGPYNAREPDKSKRWNPEHHFIDIGRHMRPLYSLIGQVGMPQAVYATPVRREADNTDRKTEGMMSDTTPFPSNYWLQVKQGEVICGFFKLPDQSDMAYICNQNAFGWQGLVLAVAQDPKNPREVFEFDREKGDWVSLGAKRVVNAALPPADALLYRFRPAPDAGKMPLVNKPKTNYDPAAHFDRFGKILADKGLLAAKKGKPDGVYSTPTRRTVDNQDKPEGLPVGLAAFPTNFPILVKQGEMLCGLFKLKDGGDAVCFANHNAHAWQGGLIDPQQTEAAPVIISEINEKTGTWTELGAWGDLNFDLAPGSAVIFKFLKTAAPKK